MQLSISIATIISEHKKFDNNLFGFTASVGYTHREIHVNLRGQKVLNAHYSRRQRLENH